MTDDSLRTPLAAAATVLVDQASKALASREHAVATFEIIGNDGLVLGTLSVERGLMVLLAAVVAGGFAYVGMRLTRAGLIRPSVLGLLLGGVFGNLIDRVALGYVRDFVWVPFVVINLADLAIVSGIVVFLFETYRTAKREASARDRV